MPSDAGAVTGTVFDIKEFSLHDGPGVRTTVFLKGCPLRCIWCHNPEGLSAAPQLSVRENGCLHCGRCRIPCDHPECKPFGRCLHACPCGLIRLVGQRYTVDALAERLLAGADLLRESGGGITISGGEPLFQPAFTLALLRRLRPLHRMLETSGYAEPEVFRPIAEEADLLYFDLKLADRKAHHTYTGVYPDRIHANLRYMQERGIPHLIRVPLIPDITDTEENLRGIAALAGDSPVELLPYNTMAAAKYAGLGMTFTDKIKSNENRPVDLSWFKNAHIR